LPQQRLRPTPAIVSKVGARRLPRYALIVLTLVYVLAGFLGRSPWKSYDISNFGLMNELATGTSSWLSPNVLGNLPESSALLPYWLGAISIQSFSWLLGTELAVKLPFILMLAATICLAWYGVYYLALSRHAQPVPFAFGGEATPKEYAKSIADASSLAFMACIGLAQTSHEVGPALSQLFFATLIFSSCAALPQRHYLPLMGYLLGVLGLSLSGAPSIALFLGISACVIGTWALIGQLFSIQGPSPDFKINCFKVSFILCSTVIIAIVSWQLQLFRSHLSVHNFSLMELQKINRLLLWYTWPLWPMVLWTLWHWRFHLKNRHIAWPICFLVVALAQLLFTQDSDSALTLALPGLAALSAFALPTLKRRISALVDWLTLIFFSIVTFIIWIMWIAMMTGFPEQPARNVKKLLPGFEYQFSWVLFLLAMVGTLAWVYLVRWRTSQHRNSIWKSMVIPAGGTILSWLLLMTLWLPVFDFARSYQPLMAQVNEVIGKTSCVYGSHLDLGQASALKYYSHNTVVNFSEQEKINCSWWVRSSTFNPEMTLVTSKEWLLVNKLRRPSDNNEEFLIYRLHSSQ
jgi:hypothetical protein